MALLPLHRRVGMVVFDHRIDSVQMNFVVVDIHHFHQDYSSHLLTFAVFWQVCVGYDRRNELLEDTYMMIVSNMFVIILRAVFICLGNGIKENAIDALSNRVRRKETENAEHHGDSMAFF